MTLHILHNTHVYHHPLIPNLFTFFLTIFSIFTPRHVLHFFLPLHGHIIPIFHTPHAYHHPPIPNLLTFFLTTFSLSTPHHIPIFSSNALQTHFLHLCMTMLTSIPVATLHPIPCTWPLSCPSCPSSHSHLIPPIHIPI